MDAVAWLLLSGIVIGTFAGSMVLLFAPSDMLTVRYQNAMLRKTALPLKDEHFNNMPKVLFYIRLIGLSLLVVSLKIVGWAIFSAVAEAPVYVG